MVDYGERLAEAMKKKQVTTQKLADHLKISYQAVKKVLDGTSSSLNAENSAKAAKFLSVDHFWLATGEGESELLKDWPFDSIPPHDYYGLDAGLREEIEDRLMGAVIRTRRLKAA